MSAMPNFPSSSQTRAGAWRIGLGDTCLSDDEPRSMTSVFISHPVVGAVRDAEYRVVLGFLRDTGKAANAWDTVVN